MWWSIFSFDFRTASHSLYIYIYLRTKCTLKVHKSLHYIFTHQLQKYTETYTHTSCTHKFATNGVQSRIKKHTNCLYDDEHQTENWLSYQHTLHLGSASDRMTWRYEATGLLRWECDGADLVGLLELVAWPVTHTCPQ